MVMMAMIVGCIVVVISAGLSGDLVDEVGGLLLNCLDGGGLGVIVSSWVGHFCRFVELIGEKGKVVFDGEL